MYLSGKKTAERSALRAKRFIKGRAEANPEDLSSEHPVHPVCPFPSHKKKLKKITREKYLGWDEWCWAKIYEYSGAARFFKKFGVLVPALSYR
ncbi:MAG: hypothetical protein H0U27_01810 [Nitrosopumilus sp.]|nr:hypothetical protein [Nitrosopumilus sp.]